MRISIAEHFSRTPGSRYAPRSGQESDCSGETCRLKVIEPALREAVRSGEVLVVVLDGVSGYAAAFLEEAFGGLRKRFSKREIAEHLVVRAESGRYAHYAVLVSKYLEEGCIGSDTLRPA